MSSASTGLDVVACKKKLTELLARLKPRSEEHVHLDFFFDEAPPPEDHLAIVQKMFEIGCDVVKDRRDEVLCLAIIGLRPDENLDVRPPTVDTIAADIADEDAEPGAVYFMPRDAGQVLMRQEEYRRPCALPTFMTRDGWYPEYRTYRDAPDDLFWRGIWVHDLPEQFRV